MPVICRRRLGRRLSAARRRAGAEDGFSMLFAIVALVIAMLVVAAVFTAVNDDIGLGQQDLDGKRAYSAAEAALNRYLYELNESPNYWQTCSNDTQSITSVPGSATGEQYSYQVVPANGYTSCSSSDPVDSLIDQSTGSLRVAFTGYSNKGKVQRSVVAGFRQKSPFDFLWFTVYEALDSSINGLGDCGTYYRNNRDASCNINWVTGDVMNGPMFTDDQYLILSGNAPVFGRTSSDDIESAATGSSASAVCAGGSCQNAVFKGTPVWNQQVLSPPSNNQFLATDAAAHGDVYTGTTTITLNSGGTATVVNCPTSTCSTTTLDPVPPIIYVSKASGCTPAQYSPIVSSYPTSGCAGDVYVSGTYTSSLTIGAADDIIISSNLETTQNSSGVPTGSATLGLVANEFIRVEHGCPITSGNPPYGTNTSGQYTQNLTIDAAIMAIQHSFIVDNYFCGAQMGNLTINGAIAQNFRGAVGAQESYNGTTYMTGYLKSYSYDNRLAYLLPPYLFDASSAGWRLSRNTLCVSGGSNPSTTC